jgi:hypothetical protein
MRFSQEINDCLYRAGWHEGRAIDLTLDASKKIPTDHPALKILSEFGDLRFRSDLNVREDWKGCIDVFEREAADDLLAGIQKVENVLQTKIVGIGTLDVSDSIFVTSDGGIILEDVSLCYWASSFDDFLERILVGRKRADPPQRYLPGSWPIPWGTQSGETK